MSEDMTTDPGAEGADDGALQDQLVDAAAAEMAAPGAAEFNELGGAAPQLNPAALSVLYDLSMPVAIELGRTRMSVQDILALGRGSVVQLDRLAGEPIDVFVGDRRFAEGEVVVVGEQFGVRITRVLARAPVGPAEALA